MNQSETMSSCFELVFKNGPLVEKILKELVDEDKLFSQFELRLISKAFGSEFLKLLRKNCANFKLDLAFDWDDYETVTKINNQLIPKIGVSKCLRFLRNVAKVEIKSVNFSGDSDFSNTFQVHELFMETLILTNEKRVKILTADEVEVCSANGKNKICLPCRQLAPMCDEYGPMTMDVLLNSFEHPHHFKLLKISDFLLQRIAIDCTAETEIKEECLSLMKTFITPNITCDHLFLPIFVMDWNMGNCEHAQPREVITEILQKWKPSTISLRFIKNRYKNVSRPWRRPNKRTFTQFHFAKDPATVNITPLENLSVRHVVVDAKWSEMEYENKEYWREPYLHLFSNLARVFPTSDDIFVVRELKKDVPLMLEEILSNLVQHSWDVSPDHNNSKLFIRLKYSEVVIHAKRNDDIPNVSGSAINGFQLSPASLEINTIFENWRNVLNDYDSTDIRIPFTLKNPSSGRELHFELVYTQSAYNIAKTNLCTPFQTMIFQLLFYHQMFGDS